MLLYFWHYFTYFFCNNPQYDGNKITYWIPSAFVRIKHYSLDGFYFIFHILCCIKTLCVLFFRGPPGNPHDVSSPYKRPRPQSPVQQRPGYPYPLDPQSRRNYTTGVASVYPMYRPEYQVTLVPIHVIVFNQGGFSVFSNTFQAQILVRD